MPLFCYIGCNVHHEGGFSHCRTGSKQDQVGAVKSGRQTVQCGKTGWNSDILFFVVPRYSLKLVIQFENCAVNLNQTGRILALTDFIKLLLGKFH